MVRTRKQDTRRLYPAFPGDLWSLVEAADKMTLYSLDDSPTRSRTAKTFHGYPVLGRVVIDEAEFPKVIESLRRGIYGKSRPMRCWEPHHGIRVHSGKKIVDILLCFICEVMQHFSSARSRRHVWGQVGLAPRGILNRLLKKARVPQLPVAAIGQRILRDLRKPPRELGR